ncbi:hypothetical protein PMAYCL1PPCAC_00357 [Pristionchus mayeri]|uniref:Uncharacterized protein n=1 Tax=Pristionchus mayeri TaxID=1317129 RepID=A0AAN4Z2H7_9BILA|nr:hypothetical protein PMAYCL1PPCAC_00357 [Pristionchus mayeri]
MVEQLLSHMGFHFLFRLEQVFDEIRHIPSFLSHSRCCPRYSIRNRAEHPASVRHSRISLCSRIGHGLTSQVCSAQSMLCSRDHVVLQRLIRVVLLLEVSASTYLKILNYRIVIYMANRTD